MKRSELKEAVALLEKGDWQDVPAEIAALSESLKR